MVSQTEAWEGKLLCETQHRDLSTRTEMAWEPPDGFNTTGLLRLRKAGHFLMVKQQI